MCYRKLCPEWLNHKIFFIALAVLFLFSVPFSYGEEEQKPVLLVSGPEYTLGIPFLPPNALPAWKGRYLFKEETILVYYSTEDIILSGGWKSFFCGSREYRTAPYDAGVVAFIESPRGWSVFLFFKNKETPDCTFLEPFFNRLNYFLGISEVFSFPAVIEIQGE